MTAPGRPDRIEVSKSWVNTLAFSPDGRLLATASSDNSVKLWDSQTWKVAATLDGQAAECVFAGVRTGPQNPGGGYRYGLVQLWTFPVANCGPRSRASGGRLGGGVFSDGKTVASGDGDWDRTGR